MLLSRSSSGRAVRGRNLDGGVRPLRQCVAWAILPATSRQESGLLGEAIAVCQQSCGEASLDERTAMLCVSVTRGRARHWIG